MSDTKPNISSILKNIEEIRFLLEALLKISLPSPVHSELTGEQRDVFELCDFSRNSQKKVSWTLERK